MSRRFALGLLLASGMRSAPRRTLRAKSFGTDDNYVVKYKNQTPVSTTTHCYTIEA